MGNWSLFAKELILEAVGDIDQSDVRSKCPEMGHDLASEVLEEIQSAIIRVEFTS